MSTALVTVAMILCTIPSLVVPSHLPASADSAEPIDPLLKGSVDRDTSETQSSTNTAEEAPDLATIVSNIEPIPQGKRVRRNIAHATFCLPQNVLGTLYYGLLRLTGNVVDTAAMNEVKIIVTRTPFGASLGKYIFVSVSLLAENTVRHEYGHTMQGYGHGPFYLLFEGLASFVQATISLFSPSFADGYFDRWPENEANELGGVT